jgi:hypothetical protein
MTVGHLYPLCRRTLPFGLLRQDMVEIVDSKCSWTVYVAGSKGWTGLALDVGEGHRIEDSLGVSHGCR